MGFKSAKQSNSGHYQFNNLVFPSKQIYLSINYIDKKLELLYTPFHNCFRLALSESKKRDNEEEFNYILDEVEEWIDGIKEKVVIIPADDEAFNQEFLGIMNFLKEASIFYLDKHQLPKTYLQ